MLSVSEKEILEIIEEYIKEKSFPPTVREIRSKSNLKSISSVHRNLDNLEKKGYITRVKKASRSIQIIKKLNIG